MLTILKNIVEIIENIPQYILWAEETLFNLVMESIHALFEGVMLLATLIPLPTKPSPPEFVSAINWFFPIGPIISIFTPMVAGYIAFLGIRWVFAKVGEL